MKKLFIFLLAFTSALIVYAQDTSDLRIRDALKDQELNAQYLQQDRALSQKMSALPALLGETTATCQEKCEAFCSDNGSTGPGSAACWDRCVREGYSSSYCASQCGTGGSNTSAACWQKCGFEGYSTTHCAALCGTTTSGGSAACWDRCVREGYSSAYCAPRCGTDTSAGSAACWQKCGNEGYSTGICAKRCGLN